MFLTVNNTFSEWLAIEREKRGWSQSELSRFSGLHRAVISKLESGTQPMPETLKSLAQAFSYPPETVFRAAGLLPPKPEIDELIEQILHEAAQLPRQDQEELLAFIRIKNNLRKGK